jgi:iron complex transport system permease protein
VTPTVGSGGGLDRLVVLRIPRLDVSTRVHLRAVVVTVVLAGLAFATFCWSLAVGDFPVPLRDVLATIAGRGDAESEFIVRSLRMPRALTGLLVGAALGLAGSVFQRIARNPLATPDVIGINAGAATAAVFVLVILHGSGLQVTGGALVGGLGTGLAVYLLAYRRGVGGYRLVLIGVGITAALQSITSYLLTRAHVLEAQRAVAWITGSLNGRSWDHVRPVAVALAVLVPITILLTRQLRALELGDDLAQGLGVRVELARGGLLLCAAALASVATAAAGPVGFVGLVAPQVGRRLVGGRSLGLLPAAAFGALLLVTSDVVGRRIAAPTELPVGVVTAILGAPYLLFLIARANRIGSGG